MAVLLAAVFYVLLKDQDLNDILNAMRGAKKFDMVLSMFAALVYVIMEGVSMQIILHSLDFKKQGLKCVKYSFIGFFFNAITPSASGGQPMQVYYMHEEGINAGASSVTLLFWTIIYKVVLVVFELYVFLFHLTADGAAVVFALSLFIPFLLYLLLGRSPYAHYHCPYHGVVGLRAPPVIRFSVL